MKKLISPDGKDTFVADALVSTYLKKGYKEETPEPPVAPGTTGDTDKSDED